MHLIVCTTPLQVLIAEKIIELYSADQFIFQMIVNIDSEKNRSYYERLSKKVFKSNYIVISNRNLLFYLFGCFLIKLKSFFALQIEGLSIDNIFIANIDNKNIHIQIYLYSFLNKLKGRLYTFDDGAANLDINSFMYRCVDGKAKKFFKRIVKFVLLSNISIYDIRRIIYGHYTIYCSKDACYRNYQRVYEVELFNRSITNSEIVYEDDMKNILLLHPKENGQVYKILLGQPFYELFSKNKFSEINYWELVSNIMSDFSIDAYFPHPRDRKKDNRINCICSNLIFEDFLLKLYTDSSFDKFIIYTFFSSSVLNLLNLPRLEIVIIKVSLIEDKNYFIFNKCKQYIENNFNEYNKVKLVKFDF